MMIKKERTIPPRPEIIKLPVRFNSDYLYAYSIVIDTRTPDEKEKNLREKKLGGPFQIFIHGHSINPDHGYELSSELAVNSKSGLLIVVLCNVPYGKIKAWHGDNGKDVIHMEVARYVLDRHGIYIDGYEPITNLSVEVNGTDMSKLVPGKDHIHAKFAVIGWSHGGILARRFSHAYPGSTVALAQMAPGGYFKWGWDQRITGAFSVYFRFIIEGLMMNTGFFRGEAKQINEASSDTVEWLFAETFGAFESCRKGNFYWKKLFRAFKDIQCAAIYLDDEKFSVGHLKYIGVMFAKNDSLFRFKKLGFKKAENQTGEEISSFFKKYFPGAVKNEAKTSFRILPGNHIAPLVHYKEYASNVLDMINIRNL